MPENQNIEYKETWRDEYLKWICGIANANGGIIFIGKNNAGEIINVEDAQRLLEDIPNKVMDTLGILIDVTTRSICKHIAKAQQTNL
jgi:ATP-dependent DNA helicase RecG